MKQSASTVVGYKVAHYRFYLPVARKRTEQEWAEFDHAAARLDQMIAETGLSEEEIVEDLKSGVHKSANEPPKALTPDAPPQIEALAET